MPGNSRRTAASNGDRKVAAGNGPTPKAVSPRPRLRYSATSRARQRLLNTSCRARATTNSPAGVGTTSCVPRSNSTQAQLGFGRLDAARQRRLAQVHLFGRAHEAAPVGDGDDMCPASEIHARSCRLALQPVHRYCINYALDSIGCPPEESRRTHTRRHSVNLVQNIVLVAIILVFAALEIRSRKHEHFPCHGGRHQAGAVHVPRAGGGVAALHLRGDGQAVRAGDAGAARRMGGSAVVGHGRDPAGRRRHDAVLVAPRLAHAAAVAAAPRAPHGALHEHPHHLPQQLLLLPDDAGPVGLGRADLPGLRHGLPGLHRGQADGDPRRAQRRAAGTSRCTA